VSTFLITEANEAANPEIIGVDTRAVVGPKLPVLGGSDRGVTRPGRRGLPKDWVELMYADYLRLKSLRKTAALYGRTNQNLHDIFKRRGFCTKRKLHEPVLYKGKKYTPCKGGLRRTDDRQRRCQRKNFLHHAIWEDNFGPIPERHEVTFANGDRSDFRPENLICLSAAEMRRRNASGENQHTKSAGEKRVLENMGFIVQRAQRHAATFGADLDDLIQEGRLAVMRASRTFRKDKGVKFLTYASFWIRSRMETHCRRHSKAVRLPSTGKAFVNCVSLDEPMGEDGDRTLADVMLIEDESVTTSADFAMKSEALRRVIKRLPRQMRIVLEGRFWEGKTLEEIALKLRVTRERIRQIEFAALRRLRKSRVLKRIEA
jgi:RNA polymerase sigma factor (sigma-70 family)